MSDYSGALEAVDRIVNRESEADEVLRQTVEVLHDRFDHYSWVGIYLVEEGRPRARAVEGAAGHRPRPDPDRPGRRAARRPRAARPRSSTT